MQAQNHSELRHASVLGKLLHFSIANMDIQIAELTTEFSITQTGVVNVP